MTFEKSFAINNSSTRIYLVKYKFCVFVIYVKYVFSLLLYI